MNRNTVHISIAGGFGNQLFQLSAALKLTQGDVIVHDFQKNARRNRNGDLEIQEFVLPERVQFAADSKISRLGKRYINFFYGLGTHRNNRRWTHLKKVALLFAPVFFSRVLGKRVKVFVATGLGDFSYDVPRTDVLILGYFQSWEWSSALSDWATKQDFSLIMQNPKLPIARKNEESFVICLHIRRGDYKSEPKIGILGDSYFNESLSYLLKKHPEAEVWLFSDETIDIKEWMRQDFQSKVRIVPEASTSLTFEAMRNANAYIISNSTFSWWAARTSYSSQISVIAPHPWFKALESPKGIVPKSWELISSNFK
jgi:hypothetical protein